MNDCDHCLLISPSLCKLAPCGAPENQTLFVNKCKSHWFTTQTSYGPSSSSGGGGRSECRLALRVWPHGTGLGADTAGRGLVHPVLSTFGPMASSLLLGELC